MSESGSSNFCEIASFRLILHEGIEMSLLNGRGIWAKSSDWANWFKRVRPKIVLTYINMHDVILPFGQDTACTNRYESRNMKI